jgi:hypothetical protein
MTTFVDLYFPPNLPIERDQIQLAIEGDLGTTAEVVGAGSGAAGSNLDLEISETANLRSLLTALAVTLTRLGVPDETLIQVSEPPGKIALSELRSRYSTT